MLKTESRILTNHIIFTGNTGSAKTAVARLFARILKENGNIWILSVAGKAIKQEKNNESKNKSVK